MATKRPKSQQRLLPQKKVHGTRRRKTSPSKKVLPELYQAGRDNPSTTAFDIERGVETLVPSCNPQSGPPEGKIKWYNNGPKGISCTLTLERVQKSGGHLHPGGPTGTVSPASFTLTTDYPQNLVVEVSLPEASGTINMIGKWSTGQRFICPNICTLPGLIELTNSPGVVLTGTLPEHPRNHFGTPKLVSAIKQLASKFHAQFNKPLYVNDMSIQDGGLYDYQLGWKPPHEKHREGRTVDMNSKTMNATERSFFEKTAKDVGFISVTLEYPGGPKEHWHLYI